MAFAIIWQNWSNNRDRNAIDPADGYFGPIYLNTEAGKDFIEYVDRDQSVMLRQFVRGRKIFMDN